MVLLEGARAPAVSTLDRVREVVRDPGVDDELAVAALGERSFERGEHRPGEPAPTVVGIYQDVEQRRVVGRPARAGDRETDEPLASEDRGHHRPSRRDLVPHLPIGERASAPFGALELEQAHPEGAPGPLAGGDQPRRGYAGVTFSAFSLLRRGSIPLS
jgi:hypothetical protein